MVKNVRKGTDTFVNSDGVGSVVGSRLYFWADDGVHGMEPWVSDGTSRGTRLIADINVGSAGSLDAYAGDYLTGTRFISIFGGLVFGADVGSGSRLFFLKGSVPSLVGSDLPIVKPPKRRGVYDIDTLGLQRAGPVLYVSFCSSSAGCELGVLSESP
jgi:ELWxxDGT repeat protein